MVKYWISLLIFLGSSSCLAQDSGKRQHIVFPVPHLSPSEAVKLAAAYVAKTKNINEKTFRLGGVRFEYFSSIPVPAGVLSVGWTIDFDCVPEKVDCHYSVGISNDRKPKLVMYPVP